MSKETHQPERASRAHPVVRVVCGLLRVAIVVALIGGGIYAAHWFRTSSGTVAQTETVAREEASRLVDVDLAEVATCPVVVRAMGMVSPAREAVITPRVTGAIVEEHADFEPGGFFSMGQQMLRIDPIDYEQAIEQRRSDVARAEAALQIELGDQALAREELELLDVEVPEINRDQILRIPQVNRARAEVRSAEAALERAKLDLERTRIVAPFDGHVVERLVTLGDNVSAGDRLARLVASDEYWVELTLPVSNLRWIDTPSVDEPGSVAHIAFERAWGPGVTREGVVARRVGELERDSGLARLIVSIADPLSLSDAHAVKPELIVGAFVDVQIEGRALDNCVVIDRNLLREGDVVWVMGPDDRRVTKRVEVAHRGAREVYITDGLDDGNRVVRTNLTAPVDGMLLRVANATSDTDDALAAQGGSASGG